MSYLCTISAIFSCVLCFPVFQCIGEFQVGVITFNMMLHVNKSSVKLNITELAEFIANELEVSVSQVIVVLDLTFSPFMLSLVDSWHYHQY